MREKISRHMISGYLFKVTYKHPNYTFLQTAVIECFPDNIAVIRIVNNLESLEERMHWRKIMHRALEQAARTEVKRLYHGAILSVERIDQ